MQKPSVLVLEVPYKSNLQNSRVVYRRKHNAALSGTPASNRGVVLGNLNTDIRPTNVPRMARHKVAAVAHILHDDDIPEEFDWTKENSNISKPENQMLCGSCWAITAAQILSDVFVVSGRVQGNPKISTTYCLSCYGQDQCHGGNPAELLLKFRDKGVSDDNCIDYSWCANDRECAGQPTNHFATNSLADRLNKLIPTPCACSQAGKQQVYFAKSVSYIAMNPDDYKPTEIVYSVDDVVSVVKNHIKLHGPVLGSFHVFEPFLDGDFSETGGVYLDDFPYNDQDTQKWIGSHAVAVTGWGVQEVGGGGGGNNGGRSLAGKLRSIPFWWCRNSWRSDWGENGYFKMAMFPHNTRVQFEQAVVVYDSDDKELYLAGGFSMVEAGHIEQKNLPAVVKQKPTRKFRQ